jgi:hypothetical protein
MELDAPVKNSRCGGLSPGHRIEKDTVARQMEDGDCYLGGAFMGN